MKIKIFYVGKGPCGEIEIQDTSVKVTELKERIAPLAGLSADQMRLIYAGKMLHDGGKLADADVPAKIDTITILVMPASSSSSASPSRAASTELKSASPNSSASSSPSSSVSSAPLSAAAEIKPMSEPIPLVMPQEAPPQPMVPLPVPAIQQPSSAKEGSVVIEPTEDGHFINKVVSAILKNAKLLHEAASVDPDSLKDTRHFGSASAFLQRLKSVAQKHQPQMKAFAFPDPFEGLTVSLQKLETKSVPDYASVIKFIQAVESRLHMNLWKPYFLALKAKFEQMYATVKSTRNGPIVEALLVRQSELNKIVKEIIDRPSIVDTLNERQGAIETKISEVEAAIKAFHEAESRLFDTKAEAQYKKLLPQLSDVERIADEKLVQLETLRELYGRFLPMEKEKQEHVAAMNALVAAPEHDLQATVADLSRLRENIVLIRDGESRRASQITSERNNIAAQRKELAQEQSLIQALMLKLAEMYEVNESKLDELAAKDSELAKEAEDRKHLLEDAVGDVQEHEKKLETFKSDLEAALKSIDIFRQGSLVEFDSLHTVTSSRKTDYDAAMKKTLNEKFKVASHHYRILFRRAWALRAFKNDSANIIAELDDQLQRWSSLHRSTMVDTFKEQITKVHQDIATTDAELDEIEKTLKALDAGFDSINAQFIEMGMDAMPSPRIDAEIECLEREKQLLEQADIKSAQGEKTRQEKLRLLSSQIETSKDFKRTSSALLASSNPSPVAASPSNGSSETPTPIDGSFVNVPR